jgi:TonB family protein
MALRCFLFSSDEGTVANLRQILDGLGVDAEPCSDAVKAAEKITNQSFQIVIIDWDQQPEAGVLLSTARDRKAAERPLTLAIVSNDPGAPQALQAGANSLIRKPIVVNQARETLTTARDLLRAKQGTAVSSSQAAAAAASSTGQGNAATLRAGEFLQTPTLSPGGQFETEMPVIAPAEVSAQESASPLKDLEPMAAAVSKAPNPPAPPPAAAAPPIGLQSYLKSRLLMPKQGASAPAPTAATPTQARGNPELASYEQSSSYSAPTLPKAEIRVIPAARPEPPSAREQQKEDELFAYMQGEREEPQEPAAGGGSLKKRAIIVALVLAGLAVFAAPQAPWHPKLLTLWNGGKQSLHAWLYPQPVTPVQAPAAHEDFGRAGDEYKLPVPEAIPDSTTDPSQIQVLPVTDPTAKKPADSTQPDQSATQPDSAASPADTPAPTPQVLTPVSQPQVNQPSPVTSPATQPNGAASNSQPVTTTIASAATNTPHPHSEATTPVTTSFPATVTAPPKYAQPRAPSMPSKVPSSLKSQMASMTPDAGGNKAPETAMPSIEPVTVTEAAERALLTDQPAPAYPANAKSGGTVTLQVLIGRDGTVQDVKFVQGSFQFARNAIDAVKQWKFKPYLMNGRPVSVQTPLTIKFSAGQ